MLFQRNEGKIIGGLIGFLIAIFILIIGILKTLFIIIFISIGCYFGNIIDKKEDVTELLDRILPPGKFK
ncbi:MAG: DUF2273 domain-containing protein [Firmicutes bacterium]|nr:DUF2273 domain-containing protein [Bacillota bacterium]